MAQFKVSGNMKVKTLKENFFESFGAVLRVYYKNHFADDDATLASIRGEGDVKGGEFECGEQDLVGVFENFMEELYGIKVQIASPDNKKLAKNDMKLCDLVNMAPVKERGKRAKITYRFNGEEYTLKNRFCQAVVRYYADQHPEAKLEDIQSVFGVVKGAPMVASREQALAILDSDGKAGGNYFLGEDDDIDVRGGKAFVWKYFSKTYFDPFMAKVKELGYEFEVIGETEEEMKEKSVKKYKYYISVGVRARGVQLVKLTEEEKDELLQEESLDDVYFDWLDEKAWEFELEDKYLAEDCDRYVLTITDENDNVVYESEDIDDVVDETDQVEEWDFKGIKDGYYLTRIQTLKCCGYSGEFELEEPFDETKLYRVRDEYIDDELTGGVMYPLSSIYYQKGEGYDMSRDKILLEDDETDEEQYWDTYLYKLTDGSYWEELENDED